MAKRFHIPPDIVTVTGTVKLVVLDLGKPA